MDCCVTSVEAFAFERDHLGGRVLLVNMGALQGEVDPRRHAEVATLLVVQEQEAKWWRDASLAYFSSVSGRPLPQGYPPAAHPLSYYQALRFDIVP